jgi:CRISPR-associated protein Cas2
VIVLVLTAVPSGLRGHLTRWLLEINAGVFVGRVNPKIRDLLWERVTDMMGPGRAILVHTADTEQGLAFRVHGHHWTPIDMEGITLMLRPTDPKTVREGRPAATMSKARQQRRRPRAV